MNTDERLEKLEKELAHAKRRSRWLLAVVGLAAGAFALVWVVVGAGCNAQGGKVPTVIRAKKFILEDEKGKARAILSADKDEPRLVLFDENGKRRVTLDAAQVGSALYLFDENGEPRAWLAVDEDGPMLGLFDAKGKASTFLFACGYGPALVLTDAKGKTRASLAVDVDGPRLVLADENGKGRAQLGVGRTVSPDGRQITYPEFSLRLLGADGKVKWQAP